MAERAIPQSPSDSAEQSETRRCHIPGQSLAEGQFAKSRRSPQKQRGPATSGLESSSNPARSPPARLVPRCSACRRVAGDLPPFPDVQIKARRAAFTVFLYAERFPAVFSHKNRSAGPRRICGDLRLFADVQIKAPPAAF